MSAGFGVYIHWPFCVAKCPYCDFNSHVRTSFDEARWVAGIVRELEAIASRQDMRPPVESVFFGGGTPSLMQAQSVGAVLEAIARLWPMADNAEITLEANPNSVEQARFREYRTAGVNRVSVGVQALNDADLAFLGRKHDAKEARHAAALAVEIFPRASLDLIYARPTQSVEEWKEELRAALSFGSEHLSLYQLTIEPGTAFATAHAQGKLTTPGDDHAAALYEVTQELCEAAGRPAYEISNHARAGAECRHNLIYWRYGDYAGAGPGAHGRISLGAQRFATQAERLPERWLAKTEELGSSLIWEEISREDAAREHLVMAMRLAEGMNIDTYERRWNASLPRAQMAALTAENFLVQADGHIAATPRGRLVLNRVISELAA
jgi:oxygen-independent coproporphyrinogen-3 oxidase